MRNLVFKALLAAVLAACALMAAPLEARAQAETDEFQSSVDRAMQHYGAREYEQAIALFEQAFAIRPEPDLVYNIARSYERLARREEAIREYQRFVGMPGTTSEMRSRALTSLQALRAEQRALEASREPEPTPEPTIETQPPPIVTAPPPATGPSDLDVAGWVFFASGVAALGAGAGFGVFAVDRNAAFEAAVPRSEEQIVLQDRVRTYALAADIFLIGGGVIAATGIVMLIASASTPRHEGSASQQPSVTLVGGPGAVGLTIDGTF